MSDTYKNILGMITKSGMTGISAYIAAGIAMVIVIIVVLVLYVVAFRLLMKLTGAFFSTIKKKRGKRIHIVFLEKIASFSVGVIIIVSLLGWKNIGGSLLGSAAVITAIVGFASQDVIKDVISGLLISIYRPFDIGDRIELEDGTVGIVESITMRHVVIIRIDTLRVVIPNSRINAASIINYSFGEIERSCLFRFPVGYESDIEKTRQIISDAVKSSPYSIPGKKQKDGSMDYGNVYFLEIAGSALIMAVTVYYSSSVPSEKLKDDINTRVFKALGEKGIDIPYDHVALVMKDDPQS